MPLRVLLLFPVIPLIAWTAVLVIVVGFLIHRCGEVRRHGGSETGAVQTGAALRAF